MPSKRDECNSLVDSESEDATRKEQVDAENLSRLSSRRVWKVDRQIWNEFEKISKEDSNTKGSWSKYLPKALNRLSQRISYVTPANRARSVLGLPLLDPLCRFAVFWDGFVTLIDATYTAYIVPISVGFFTDFVSGIAVWFHAAAGVIFMANLLLGFHIGFVVQNNLNCMVVKSGPEVARHYMRHGTFTVDLISSAVYLIHVVLLGLVNETQMPPTVSERLHTTMVVMVVLRLVRLGAIFSVLKDMLLTAATGGSISRWVPPTAQYLLVIGYMLCGMVNAMASMWFFVGRLNGAYGNPNWISSYAGSLVGDGCEEVRFAWRPGDPLPPGCEGLQPSDMPTLSFWECYGVSAYFSLTTMTTVGYGDISPVYGLEFLVGFVIMLAGVMMFAVLIGSIQEIFQSACDVLKNSSALRSKLEAVDRWTEERLLPQDLRQDIRAFYHEVWVQNEDSQREMTLFEELPHELRSRTAQIVASRIMSSVDGLKDLKAEQQDLLASKAFPVCIGPGVDLCYAGEFSDRIWILEDGELFTTHSHDKTEVVQAPAMISEDSLLADVSPELAYRLRGYRASCQCLLWELKLEDLQQVFHFKPDLGEVLRKYAAAQILSAASADEFTLQALSAEFGSSNSATKSARESPDSGSDQIEDQVESSPQDLEQLKGTVMSLKSAAVQSVLKRGREPDCGVALGPTVTSTSEPGDDEPSSPRNGEAMLRPETNAKMSIQRLTRALQAARGLDLQKQAVLPRRESTEMGSNAEVQVKLLHDILGHVRALDHRMQEIERQLRRPPQSKANHCVRKLPGSLVCDKS